MNDEAAKRDLNNEANHDSSAEGGLHMTPPGRAEALALPGFVGFGRIVFTRNALPAIRPVNHALRRLPAREARLITRMGRHHVCPGQEFRVPVLGGEGVPAPCASTQTPSAAAPARISTGVPSSSGCASRASQLLRRCLLAPHARVR
jgi:hypothetical protein